MLACENTAVENKDLLYFMPLFHFFESSIPIELGDWSVDITAHDSGKTQGHRKGPQPKQTILSNSKVTFSATSLPDELGHRKEFLEFKGFEYVKARIESDSWVPVNKDEETVIFDVCLKEVTNNVELKVTNQKRHVKEILLVKAKEVGFHFFKKYNLGLYPLTHFYAATPLANYKHVAEIARNTIKNQLGLDPMGIYDSQRVYFNLEKKDRGNCEIYLLFDYVLAIYAFAQLYKGRKFLLPNNDASILFELNNDLSGISENSLELMYFDYGLPIENTKISLKAHPIYHDKLKNDITLLERKNRALLFEHEKLKKQVVAPKKGFRAPSQSQVEFQLQKFTKQMAKNPPPSIRVIVEDIQKIYTGLTNAAAKSKEYVLKKLHEKEKYDIQIKEYSEASPH